MPMQFSSNCPPFDSVCMPSLRQKLRVAQKVSKFWILIISYWKPVDEARFFLRKWKEAPEYY